MIMTTAIRTTRAGAGALISARVPFVAAGMSGRFVTYTTDTGRLPHEHADALRELITTPDVIVFVVYSYATPIGWVACDYVTGRPVAPAVVPDVRYSVTTSRHQYITRNALGA